MLTSKTQLPQESWEQFLTTAKGKTQLKAALRKERRNINVRGEKTYLDFLKKYGLEDTNDILTKVLGICRLHNREELYYAVGNNEIVLNEEHAHMLQKHSQKGLLSKLLRNPIPIITGKISSMTSSSGSSHPRRKVDVQKEYCLKTVKGKDNYIVADCCHPIPGDDVLGFLDENNNVVVHKQNCETAMKLKSAYGGRIVVTKWKNTEPKFKASILLRGIDRMGILQEIVKVITTNLVINIRKMDISSENGVFECELVVLVENAQVVDMLCKKLKQINGVKVASRES